MFRLPAAIQVAFAAAISIVLLGFLMYLTSFPFLILQLGLRLSGFGADGFRGSLAKGEFYFEAFRDSTFAKTIEVKDFEIEFDHLNVLDLSTLKINWVKAGSVVIEASRRRPVSAEVLREDLRRGLSDFLKANSVKLGGISNLSIRAFEVRDIKLRPSRGVPQIKIDSILLKEFAYLTPDFSVGSLNVTGVGIQGQFYKPRDGQADLTVEISLPADHFSDGPLSFKLNAARHQL